MIYVALVQLLAFDSMVEVETDDHVYDIHTLFEHRRH